MSIKQVATERLYLLDALSQQVCNVIDPAELCRSTHASESWRDEAGKAFSILNDYISELNTDRRLYECLKSITQNDSLFRELSWEQQRFAQDLQAEFERDGIHLPDNERQLVRDSSNEVTELETAFSRNVETSIKQFSADASAVGEVFDVSGVSSPTVMLNNDAQTCQSILKFSPNSELRESAHVAYATGVPENLSTLDELVRARRDLSQLQGFESYAHRVLSNCIAGSPEAVLNFLDHQQTENLPQYQREMSLVLQAKQHVEGQDQSEVKPWDVSFYQNLLQNSSGFDPHAVATYFSLPRVVESLQLLVKELFGVCMVEVKSLSRTEQWDIVDDGSIKESTIQRFDFQDEQGDTLGTMYLDLYPRPEKYGHAAHFTIRCGCTVIDEITGRDLSNQLPIVALVCNVHKGQTIGHAEVETIFHEFGHVLHSLLSRTSFQHLAGTRGSMDFVEVPSHWFQNFCWDPKFLQGYLAKKNGAAIPNDMVAKLQNSRHEFKAIESRNQILYATFDQHLFGSASEPTHTMDVYGKLNDNLGIPYTPNTHWFTRHRHLITYGATYYTYLYATGVSRDIWQRRFQPNCLSREAGTRIWTQVLAHGGAKDPAIMIRDILDD